MPSLFLQSSLFSEAPDFLPAHLPAAVVMVAVAEAEVMVFAAITLAAASVALLVTAMAVTVTAPAVCVAYSAGTEAVMWGHWGTYYGPMIPMI
jgi:hypothetical protein